MSVREFKSTIPVAFVCFSQIAAITVCGGQRDDFFAVQKLYRGAPARIRRRPRPSGDPLVNQTIEVPLDRWSYAAFFFHASPLRLKQTTEYTKYKVFSYEVSCNWPPRHCRSSSSEMSRAFRNKVTVAAVS
jgi:hypothetical protein